jgi:hypothetical protein
MFPASLTDPSHPQTPPPPAHSWLDEPRYSMRETSERLSVHLITAWRWALTGYRGILLKTVRVGHRRFVLARHLDEFLDAIQNARPAAGSGSPARPLPPPTPAPSPSPARRKLRASRSREGGP